LQLTLVISFNRARLKAGRWRSSPRRFPSGQGGNPFPQSATPAELLIAPLPEFQSDRHLSVSSVATTESYAEYLLTAATTPNFSSSKCDQSRSYDAKSVSFDVQTMSESNKVNILQYPYLILFLALNQKAPLRNAALRWSTMIPQGKSPY